MDSDGYYQQVDEDRFGWTLDQPERRKVAPAAPRAQLRGATVSVNCARCKEPFTARVADRNRGWGRFCSKRCKAIRQTYG